MVVAVGDSRLVATLPVLGVGGGVLRRSSLTDEGNFVVLLLTKVYRVEYTRCFVLRYRRGLLFFSYFLPTELRPLFPFFLKARDTHRKSTCNTQVPDAPQVSRKRETCSYRGVVWGVTRPS